MQASTYKAIGLTKFGGPEVLEILDIPKPILAPHDLLVQVHAVSLNPLDFKMRNGRKAGVCDIEHPRVPGYDVAGIVVEIGSEVKNFKKGDSVYYAGDVGRYGAYSSFNTCDSRVAGKKPSKLSWAEAAALPLTGITAWECMVERMGISEDKEKNKGKKILIMNGAGGVGSIGI